jgi:hypothetical protein
MDAEHLNMVVGLSNSMHASEPVYIQTTDGSADVFVQHVAYGLEEIAKFRSRGV